ncbi:MAG: hypothetical protein ACR2MF_04770 [Chthoniobacterales bacterium]
MKSEVAIEKLRKVIRRKPFSLSTESSYCGWLKRYGSYIKKLLARPSERKLEQFRALDRRTQPIFKPEEQAGIAGKETIAFFFLCGS